MHLEFLKKIFKTKSTQDIKTMQDKKCIGVSESSNNLLLSKKVHEMHEKIQSMKKEFLDMQTRHKEEIMEKSSTIMRDLKQHIGQFENMLNHSDLQISDSIKQGFLTQIYQQTSTLYNALGVKNEYEDYTTVSQKEDTTMLQMANNTLKQMKEISAFMKEKEREALSKIKKFADLGSTKKKEGLEVRFSKSPDGSSSIEVIGLDKEKLSKLDKNTDDDIDQYYSDYENTELQTDKQLDNVQAKKTVVNMQGRKLPPIPHLNTDLLTHEETYESIEPRDSSVFTTISQHTKSQDSQSPAKLLSEQATYNEVNIPEPTELSRTYSGFEKYDHLSRYRQPRLSVSTQDIVDVLQDTENTYAIYNTHNRANNPYSTRLNPENTYYGLNSSTVVAQPNGQYQSTMLDNNTHLVVFDSESGKTMIKNNDNNVNNTDNNGVNPYVDDDGDVFYDSVEFLEEENLQK